MKIDKICLTDFRNIETLQLEPDAGVNIIYGDNAQGKTNLMEAVWLFTGAKSFRGAKENELIRFGKERCALEISFTGSGRENTAQMVFGQQKKLLLNELPLKSSGELSGKFCCVVFSPVHLALVKDGPAARRRFLDTCICQMLPSYLQALSEYSRVLSQRSCLLRDSREHAALLDTLEIWDMHLVQYGAYILSVRKRFVGKLQHHAAEIYSGLAGNTEKLSLQLASTIDGTEEDDRKLLEQRFMEKLHQNRAEDLRLGTTGVGIHRDDVDILIDGKHARSYGSQGQQRSCVLALKLAESGILQEKMGENPIILLDDVMSELDHHRRDFLLNYLGDRQVWMTCCDPQYFFSLKNGKTMRMEHGRLIGA